LQKRIVPAIGTLSRNTVVARSCLPAPLYQNPLPLPNLRPSGRLIAPLGTAGLTEILLYHVANGRRTAENVVKSEQIRMLNGQFTSISLMDGMPFISDSAIMETDVMADNGIIHIIDAMLVPATESSTVDRELSAAR